MPAVTVSDWTSLKRLPVHDPAPARQRPVASVSTAPSGLGGRGVPGSSGLRRQDLRRTRPLRAHGPDGRGRLRARRAQGDTLAPSPGLRNRHLHDRRDLRPPGLQRRRRTDHRRRHPMDDRRAGHLAHRNPPGRARRLRRALPRHPAVGEPPRQEEVDPSRLPAPRSRRRSPRGLPRRRSSGSGDRW